MKRRTYAQDVVHRALAASADGAAEQHDEAAALAGRRLRAHLEQRRTVDERAMVLALVLLDLMQRPSSRHPHPRNRRRPPADPRVPDWLGESDARTVVRALEAVDAHQGALPLAAAAAVDRLNGAIQPGTPPNPRALVHALVVLDLLEAGARIHDRAAVARRRHRNAAIGGRARAGFLDHDPATVRSWARAQGISVPTRGRFLPPVVIARWRAHDFDEWQGHPSTVASTPDAAALARWQADRGQPALRPGWRLEYGHDEQGHPLIRLTRVPLR